MFALLIAATLAQSQPAVRRSTPLTDDPGMVVRQTGTLNITCLSGCSNVVYSPDGGPLGSVTQGTLPWLVAGADGGAVQVAGSFSATNPSIGATGAATPTSATLLGGTDGTNLRAPYVITTVPDAGDPGIVVRVVGGISGGGSGGAVTQGSSPWLVASGDAGIIPTTVENTVTVTGTVNAAQSGTWNVNNVSGTVSLPTGASTSALQTTGNTSLSSIDTKTPALGQTTMAGSSPVVIASNQTAVPVSGTVTANAGSGTFAVSAAALPLPAGAATSANQTTINTQTTKLNDGVDTALITAGGALLVDGSGSTQPISGTVTANQGGTWNINNVSGTVSLPTGAATAANQTTLNTQTTKINDGTDTALVTAAGALVVDGSGSTQPVSGTVTANAGSGTFAVSAATLPLPTGAATEATLASRLGDATFTGRINTLGQKTMANSTPVVLSSDQSAVTVTGTVTASGTVTANQGTPGSTANRWPVQITDGTDLSLVSAAGALLVDGSATTQPVSGTVTANAGTGNFATNLAQVNGTTVATGSGVLGAGTQRVVLATDQPAVTVAQSTAANLRAQTSAEGATGSAVPANATNIGARDTAGTLRPLLAIDTDTSGAAIYTQGVSIVGASFGAVTQASVEASAIPGTQTGLVTREVKKHASSVVGTSVTCGTSATAAPASPLANRFSLCIYNNGSNTIFVGPTGVTTANGFPVPPGGSFCDDVNTTQVYSCIVASGTENARVLEN